MREERRAARDVPRVAPMASRPPLPVPEATTPADAPLSPTAISALATAGGEAATLRWTVELSAGLTGATFTLDMTEGVTIDMANLFESGSRSFSVSVVALGTLVVDCEVRVRQPDAPTLETLRVDIVAKTVGEAISQLRAAGLSIQLDGEIDESAVISIDLRGGLARSALDWLASAAGLSLRIEDGVAHLSPKP